MTIGAFEDDTKRDELLQIVAEELPVFVLGPGCFRVGFDNPADPNWVEVEERVAEVFTHLADDELHFFTQFFLSKLSDERRGRPEDVEQLEDRLDRHARDVRRQTNQLNDGFASFAPWRSLLAAEILRAYRHASCCLGLMIGQGLQPVLHWQSAALTTEAVEDWRASNDDSDPRAAAARHFKGSSEAIKHAADIARAFLALERGQRPTAAQIESLGGSLQSVADQASRRPAELRTVFEAPLRVLQPSAVANKLDVLLKHSFSVDFQDPLCGGHVEWLGDLLWHVLTCDAAVQPSQADIAFYVSLANSSAAPSSRELKRPAFGDRHVTESVVTRLTTRSQPSDSPHALDRQQFLETIAKCMLAQYAMVRTAESTSVGAQSPSDEDMESGRSATLDKLVLGLVGDYGDLFERELFRFLRDGETFHVCLPVWLDLRGRRSIDWVILDVTKAQGGSTSTAWRWLADAESVAGPIVVKMSGCDRSPLGVRLLRGRVQDIDFTETGLRHNKVRRGSVAPAVLYDEFDRLTAMQAFDERLRGDKSAVLASSLCTPGKGLTWTDRSWLIMGQRFGDWVPRLRLFTQMWADGNVNSEVTTRYWAIDRAFDWPERALLPSLGIEMVAADLQRVCEALTKEEFEEEMRRTPIGELFVQKLSEQRARG